MKNHFIISYVGNKREEVESVFGFIKDKLDNITYIVEPFCGSSAMSYYISTKFPKKFKYILNDNSKNLIELYNIMSNEEKLNDFIRQINNLCFTDGVFIDKETYNVLVKQDDVYGYFIKNKYYNIRLGLYPFRKTTPLDINKINKVPIISFLRNEDITFSSLDAIEIVKTHNNKDSVILLDPPYMLCNANALYENANLTIYEYLIGNLSLINSYLIVENNWIMRCIYRKNTSFIYEKKYRGLRKKIVDHIIIKL